jgi:hypothetical protein
MTRRENAAIGMDLARHGGDAATVIDSAQRDGDAATMIDLARHTRPGPTPAGELAGELP